MSSRKQQVKRRRLHLRQSHLHDKRDALLPLHMGTLLIRKSICYLLQTTFTTAGNRACESTPGASLAVGVLESGLSPDPKKLWETGAGPA
jgi:hypothetical protein